MNKEMEAQPAPVVGGPVLWWNGVDREDIATGPSVSVQRSDWHTIPLYEHPVEPVVGGEDVAGIEDALFDVIRGFGYTTSSQTGTIVYAITHNLDLRALLSARPGGEDSTRIDWLEENEADLVTHRESENEAGEYSIWWNVAKGDESISGHPLGYARDAIDEAMRLAAKAHPAQAGGGKS